MKKILLLLVVFITSLLVFSPEIFAECKYNGGSLTQELWNCLDDADLVQAWDGIIEYGVKQKIKSWTTALAGLLWLLAVGAIVYGGLLMTLSWGEDEKIKKGKDVVKWSILGFLAVVMIGSVIRIVVEVVFDIAG